MAEKIENNGWKSDILTDFMPKSWASNNNLPILSSLKHKIYAKSLEKKPNRATITRLFQAADNGLNNKPK